MAWLSPLVTTPNPDGSGTLVLLLTKQLYDERRQQQPGWAPARIDPCINPYSGDEANSVNLAYPNLDAVNADWPAYWYNPDDL